LAATKGKFENRKKSNHTIGKYINSFPVRLLYSLKEEKKKKKESRTTEKERKP